MAECRKLIIPQRPQSYRCCNGFRYVPAKQLLGLIKNITTDLFFLMVGIIILSDLYGKPD